MNENELKERVLKAKNIIIIEEDLSEWYTSAEELKKFKKIPQMGIAFFKEGKQMIWFWNDNEFNVEERELEDNPVLHPVLRSHLKKDSII
ncbi:MAG: hypothetical protein ACTSRP_18445 [Candidatus Helarchaeota archaeon]